MEMHYTRHNMRRRGPMESRKLQDHFQQTANGVERLQKRKDELRTLLATVRACVETGDVPGSIEGSVYAHAAQAGRQLETVERWEAHD